jgi:predicted AlkP superfamily pyrophosphatase or phosphodiesterase
MHAIQKVSLRRTYRAKALCVLIFLLSVGSYAESSLPVIDSANEPNTLEQRGKHYVVLVSLDGFRYDYPRKYGAHNLLRIASRGASVPEGMIPVYPSLTFPNHYSIVTGLYPEHHGIVGMNFYDPQTRKHFSYRNPSDSNDGTWYAGTPLWTLAEQQGMRTACFFWPGSEAEIAGARPAHYLHFNDHLPDEARIDQVIRWLQLPPDQRPHLITLYYSNVDHAGHEFGPNSTEVENAVHHVDKLVGTLWQKLQQLDLPIDFIVVSDHGMDTIQGDWIDLDRFADLSKFQTDGMFLYPENEQAAQQAYEHLKGASDKFEVYRRRDLPRHLHFDENERAGDPVVIATGPYSIRAHGQNDSSGKMVGMHGYDPSRLKTMRAIFYTAGPDIRAGIKLAPFENVDVFPLIVKILRLKTVPNDGNFYLLKILRNR